MTNRGLHARESRRRKLAIDAAVLAGGVVLGSVGIWIGTASQSSPMPNPNQVLASPPRVAGGSSCGLAGADPAGAQVRSAPAARWAVVGTMAAPSSPAAGPGRQAEDGLRSCFAHTAEGAVFAVGNIWAMGSDPRLYRTVLERATASGEGRKQALQQSIGPSNTGTSAQIAGFKLLSYRPEESTVDVAFQLSDGSQISFPAPVRWEDGDWKLELAGNGTPVFRPTLLDSLSGYVPWAAQR